MLCKKHNVEFEPLKGCPECLKEKHQHQWERNVDGEVVLADYANIGGDQTAMIRVSPEKDDAVHKLYQESVKLLNLATDREIKSPEDVNLATDDLSVISRLKKTYEEKRKEYVTPINQHVKDVNQVFKDFLDPLTKADEINRAKILKYNKEQEELRKAEEEINAMRMEAARKEMELKGELSEPVDLVEVTPSPAHISRANVGTSSIAKYWHWEVVDFSLVPDMYKMPDAQKIKKTVQSGGTIPGIRAWQEDGLRVTAKEG